MHIKGIAKMNKICILGNSHVACIKKAWDNSSSEGFDIDFFAHQAQGMQALRIEGDHLVPTNDRLKLALKRSSSGKSIIKPDEYSALVLVGLGLELLHLNTLNKYSKAVIKASYSDYVKQTLLYRLAKQIRSISEQRLYVLHSPLKSKNAAPAGCEVYIRSINLMAEVFAEIGNVQILAQPLETIVEDRFTAPQYAKSALKLDIGEIDEHHIEDGAHMNADFGKLLLDDIQTTITKM